MPGSQKQTRQPQEVSDATSMFTYQRNPQSMATWNQDEKSFTSYVYQKKRKVKQERKQIQKAKAQQAENQQINEIMQKPKKKKTQDRLTTNEKELFKKWIKKPGYSFKVISKDLGSKTLKQVEGYAQYLKQQILRDPNHPDKDLMRFLPGNKVVFTENDELKIIQVLTKDGVINYENLQKALQNKTYQQLENKIRTMRLKIAKDPKEYGKEIADILNDIIVHEHWTQGQKQNFIRALEFYGKDFKIIADSKMVEGKTHKQIISHGKEMRNRLLKKQDKTADETQLLAILQGQNTNEIYVWSESDNKKIIEVMRAFQKVDYSELKKELPKKTEQQIRNRIDRMRSQAILHPTKFDPKIGRILSEVKECIPWSDKENQIIKKAIKKGKTYKQIQESQELEGRTDLAIKLYYFKLKKQGQN